MKFKRLLILGLAALSSVSAVRADNESLAAIFTNAVKNVRAAQPRDSIIVFACDGLRAGDLSCYGQTHFQTPNLDRLAAEGMRFTDYRAGGDELAQAQAALLNGHNTNQPATEPTLATRLQQAGYTTGMLGEWMLGTQFGAWGFDDFTGFVNDQDARDYYAPFIWRYMPRRSYDLANHKWGAAPKDGPRNAGPEALYRNQDGKRQQYIPDVLMDAADNFVRIYHPDVANHYRPFFLLVNLPAPRSATAGKDDFPVPTDAPFSDEAWPQPAKNRAALLTRMDQSMGRFMEQLKKYGMTNNVAIFFTGAVAPQKFANTNLNFLELPGDVRGGTNEVHLRVPMIVRWPGHTPEGRVSRRPWSAADFAPTALAMAQVKSAAIGAGISMLPTLEGEPGTNAPAAPDGPGL